MLIDYTERQLILEQCDLSHPNEAAKLLNKLLSVMFYPENEESQRLFLIGQKYEILKHWQNAAEKNKLLEDRHDIAIELALLDRKKADGVIERTMRSRQGGGMGGLFMRGIVAGTLLQYLRIEGTLTGAYELYQEYAQGYRSEAGDVEPILLTPSSLRKTWEDYLPVVSHWAAWAGFLHLYGCLPLAGPKVTYPETLATLLPAASSWHGYLVELKDPSNPNAYLVPDPCQLWSILDHNKKTFS